MLKKYGDEFSSTTNQSIAHRCSLVKHQSTNFYKQFFTAWLTSFRSINHYYG